MNRKLVGLTVVFSFITLLSAVALSQKQAQPLTEDLRPFDFSAKYYEINGIFASTLVDRKTGADGESVFDKTNNPNFSEIRITATLPAYTGRGEGIYWNYYGGASKGSFTNDAAGGIAVELGYVYPMYTFPSTTVGGSDRQAVMILMGESYFEKNHIGIAAVFVVEFTKLIFTDEGRAAMQLMAERNGLSIDGTPIIKTAKELEGLAANGFVSISRVEPETSKRSPFVIAKVIQYPESGGIAPDAFLMYTKEQDGTPLASEAHFVSKFDCYQGDGLCF